MTDSHRKFLILLVVTRCIDGYTVLSFHVGVTKRDGHQPDFDALNVVVGQDQMGEKRLRTGAAAARGRCADFASDPGRRPASEQASWRPHDCAARRSAKLTIWLDCSPRWRRGASIELSGPSEGLERHLRTSRPC